MWLFERMHKLYLLYAIHITLLQCTLYTLYNVHVHIHAENKRIIEFIISQIVSV